MLRQPPSLESIETAAEKIRTLKKKKASYEEVKQAVDEYKALKEATETNATIVGYIYQTSYIIPSKPHDILQKYECFIPSMGMCFNKELARKAKKPDNEDLIHHSKTILKKILLPKELLDRFAKELEYHSVIRIHETEHFFDFTFLDMEFEANEEEFNEKYKQYGTLILPNYIMRYLQDPSLDTHSVTAKRILSIANSLDRVEKQSLRECLEGRINWLHKNTPKKTCTPTLLTGAVALTAGAATTYLSGNISLGMIATGAAFFSKSQYIEAKKNRGIAYGNEIFNALSTRHYAYPSEEKQGFFAILREPGKSFVNAIAEDKTHLKPDYKKTMEEYASYIKTLQQMGVETFVCPADENFPDGNFVEDPYFVLDDKLIIQLNPGTPSRKEEYTTLAPYLPKNLPLFVIPKEFTIDGGDILKDGTDIYIGLSKRTQLEAIQFFETLVKKHGYHVHAVPVPQGLHLKSGMTTVTHKNYVIQAAFEPFIQERQKKDASIRYFIVPEKEKHAANVLTVNGHIMLPDKCPQTKAYIAQFYPSHLIHEVSTDQVRLVDGALTCGSLLFQRQKPAPQQEASTSERRSGLGLRSSVG